MSELAELLNRAEELFLEDLENYTEEERYERKHEIADQLTPTNYYSTLEVLASSRSLFIEELQCIPQTLGDAIQQTIYRVIVDHLCAVEKRWEEEQAENQEANDAIWEEFLRNHEMGF